MGAPAELLSGLHVDSANYSVANDLLIKRYRDKRKLLQKYIDSFLELPQCDNSVTSLRSFYTTLVLSSRNLLNKGVNIDDYSLMLASKIIGKLPESLRIKIIESFSDVDWQISQIIAALDKHLTVVEACVSESTMNKNNVTINSLATNASQLNNKYVDKVMCCAFCDGTNHKSM